MLEGLERRIREVSISIEKARCTFQTEFDRAYATLFPYGIFSKAIRHFRKWFGGKFFHDADLETISPLLQIAALLASLIDQKLLDDNGNIL